MIVKRYVANTAQEAMEQIKYDLGQDAIILNTRRIRKKGWKAWFYRPLVEVTAAVDDVIVTNNSNNRILKSSKEEVLPQETNLKEIEKKVDQMGKMMQKFISGMGIDDSNKPHKFPPEGKELYQLLINHEVCEEYVVELINATIKLHNDKKSMFYGCFEQVLLEYLGKPEPITITPGDRKVVMFIGPTGVGKTTTLAKLAAFFSIQQNKKVGLITADTYRIAAADQLRIYAEILGLPFNIVYSPHEIIKALEEHKEQDIVLIDTAGKSIGDKEQEQEIKKLISLAKADEIYLVISSNTGSQGCINIINSYQFIPHYKLIFTKMDEITTYGTILNCCLSSGKPLSYLTNGQSVPEDIEIADPVKIKNSLMENSSI